MHLETVISVFSFSLAPLFTIGSSTQTAANILISSPTFESVTMYL